MNLCTRQTFAKVAYENMTTDAETMLYPSSTNFTQLSPVLKLINLKALNEWTDKSFSKLLQLLKYLFIFDLIRQRDTLSDGYGI